MMPIGEHQLENRVGLRRLHLHLLPPSRAKALLLDRRLPHALVHLVRVRVRGRARARARVRVRGRVRGRARARARVPHALVHP